MGGFSSVRVATTGGMQASDRRARRLQVAALLVLAPIGAEYLAAYDDSTGNVGALLLGLVIFVLGGVRPLLQHFDEP